MSRDITPTHRTTSTIGSIPYCTDIQIANIEDFDDIDDLIESFGPASVGLTVSGTQGNYRIHDELANETHWLFEEGYLITDGRYYASTVNDKSFEPLTVTEEPKPKERHYFLTFYMKNGNVVMSKAISAADLDGKGITDALVRNTKPDALAIPVSDTESFIVYPENISHVSVVDA